MDELAKDPLVAKLLRDVTSDFYHASEQDNPFSAGAINKE
jgi:hypothetical protein